MSERHEDDLRAEAYAAGGAVEVDHLFEHMQMIVAHPEAYGSSVTEPLRATLELLEHAYLEHKDTMPTKVYLRTTEL